MKKIWKKIKNSRIVKVLFARKAVVVCIVILLIMVLAAIFAPLVAPYDPYQQDLEPPQLPPFAFDNTPHASHLLNSPGAYRPTRSKSKTAPFLCRL